jgi:membrane-bound serine protease (ClpP class)
MTAVGLGILAGAAVAVTWGAWVWVALALLAVGLALLAVEAFLVPGFGVPGVLGLVALGAGAVVALAGAGGVDGEALGQAGANLALAGLAAAMGGVLLWRFGRGRRRRLARAFPGLVLRADVGGAPGTGGIGGAGNAGRGPRARLRGAQGVALSDLRPAGFARIGGARLDVVTRGEYVAAGEPVEVVADEGYRRVVRRLASRSERSERSEPAVEAPTRRRKGVAAP